MLDKLYDEYIETPNRAVDFAYNRLEEAIKDGILNAENTDDVLPDYTVMIGEPAFYAGFAAAMELMQDVAAARKNS